LVLLAWDHKLCRGVLAPSVLDDPKKKTRAGGCRRRGY